MGEGTCLSAIDLGFTHSRFSQTPPVANPENRIENSPQEQLAIILLHSLFLNYF